MKGLFNRICRVDKLLKQRKETIIGRNTLVNMSIQDIKIAKIFGWSNHEIIGHNAFQTKRKLENLFCDMIFAWSKGNKPSISKEKAKELDEKYRKVVHEFENNTGIDCMGDTIVKFSAIPDNDYSIVFYMGYPFDSEICKWAKEQLNKCENDLII